MKSTLGLQRTAQTATAAAALATGKYAHQLLVSLEEKTFRSAEEVKYANAAHRIALKAFAVSRELAELTKEEIE